MVEAPDREMTKCEVFILSEMSSKNIFTSDCCLAALYKANTFDKSSFRHCCVIRRFFLSEIGSNKNALGTVYESIFAPALPPITKIFIVVSALIIG